MSKAVRAEIEAFTRRLLKERLAQLTAPQLEGFKRLFGSVDEVLESKLISAIDLCNRSIAKTAEERTCPVERYQADMWRSSD